VEQAATEIPVRDRVRLPDPLRPAFNPSVCGDKVLVRTATYDLHDDGRVTLLGDLNTTNYLYRFKPEGWEVEEFKPPEHLLWKHGLEDGRLFKWMDREWILFSACFQDPKSRWRIVARNTMVLMDLETKEFVPLHTDTLREKNWMPIPGESLNFLYSTKPWVVLSSSGDVILTEEGSQKWSGSSCFIPFDGKWLGVVHKRRIPGVYDHAFVLMNSDLTLNRFSKPFHFHKEQIEFCAGLDQQGEDFILSYGVMDREAWLARVSRETIYDYLKK
jgi:hypothetical protein